MSDRYSVIWDIETYNTPEVRDEWAKKTKNGFCTDWKQHEITVLGVMKVDSNINALSIHQFIGEQQIAANFDDMFAGAVHNIGYNQNSFDSLVVRARLGIGAASLVSDNPIDLKTVCHKANIYGGLKKTELTLGFKRTLKPLDHLQMFKCFEDWRDGKNPIKAMGTLLPYNLEDLIGSQFILKDRLGSLNHD